MNGTTTAQLAEKTAKAVTGSVEEWTGFLQSAARLYKYSYPEQLLIYAQRPDATACASYEIWNQTMRRYVRRGARGIALPDGAGAVRYVFDVADTGARKSSREVKTWALDENNRKLSLMRWKRSTARQRNWALPDSLKKSRCSRAWTIGNGIRTSCAVSLTGASLKGMMSLTSKSRFETQRRRA